MQLISNRKRDGRTDAFEAAKITRAIAQAGHATGEFGDQEALVLTMKTLDQAESLMDEVMVEVEKTLDMVEYILLESTSRVTAEAYILFREQRDHLRNLSAKANGNLMDSRLQCRTGQLTNSLEGAGSTWPPFQTSSRTLVKLKPRRTAHFTPRRPEEKNGSGFFRSGSRRVFRSKVQLHLPLLLQPATNVSSRGALSRKRNSGLPAAPPPLSGRGARLRRGTDLVRLGQVIKKTLRAGLQRQAGYQLKPKWPIP